MAELESEADPVPAAVGLSARRSVERLVIATFGLLGFGVGARGIADNSEFVHLRTGIEIVRTGRIPHSDIYSFTAHGQPWIVQSWLASVAYGIAFRAGGVVFGTGQEVHMVVLLQALLMGGLGVVIARLARTGAGVRTMASAGVAVTLSVLYWSPRPLIFGLLGLALLINVVERRRNPLLLIPIMWIWVNTHGSFPLGIGWLGLWMLGSAVDRRSVRDLPWRVVLATGAGLVIACVNPIGPKLLAFPLTVGDKQAAFKHIVEWASPNFQTGQGIAALVLIGLGAIVLIRARLPWSDVLPVAAFLVLGLFAARNLAAFGVVLAIPLGHALAAPQMPNPQATVAGGTDGPERRLHAAAAIALGFMLIAFTVSSLSGTGLQLSSYPTLAEGWLQQNGRVDPSQHRILTQDWVGCYHILLRGVRGRVFIDDRVDMYPLSVSADYEALLHADPSSPEIVQRYGIDTVLWQRRLRLPEALIASGMWQTSYQDRDWLVLTKQ
ncbi:MAG: hypothetical protein NVS3B21_00910 [Acidimicrobiales bacterium]